ncbi:MAG TPA: D-cysteine desulfhydrase, partial [Firmicutes bacterium]|nr:D-cysteine desulfhydrase [Bacillota bacterium]
MYLAKFPRVELATLPTALQPAPRFSKALGGKVNIWIKRDDNSGLTLGGNKARKLEFLLADALRQGCDTLITTGGPQSNHCRMTAGAAAKVGMQCHLVFSSSSFDLRQGNLLVDELLGAQLHWCDPAEVDDINKEMSKLANELQAQGRRPYIIPLGGSNSLGAMGYVYAVREFLQQADALGLQFASFVHASGSGGTQA